MPGPLPRIAAGAERVEIGGGQPREDGAGRDRPEALGDTRIGCPDADAVLPMRRPRLLDAHPEVGGELVARPAAAVDLDDELRRGQTRPDVEVPLDMPAALSASGSR